MGGGGVDEEREQGDERQLGLQAGDGPINWQPLAPLARFVAMQEGMIDPQYVEEGPDGSVHVALDEPVLEQEIDGVEYAWLNEEWVVLTPDGAMPPPLTPEQAELLRSLEPGAN